MLRLAISPINWSNDDDHSLGANISLAQCLSEMRLAGFIGCEAGHKFPQDPIQLKPILNKYNLSLLSKWFSAYTIEKDKSKNNLADFKKHLEFLQAMDCKVAVVCECSYSVHSNPDLCLAERPVWELDQIKIIGQYLNQLGNIAQDYNIDLVYHSHMGTGIETEQELDLLMSHTDASSVKLLLDTGHLYFAGANVEQVINNYAERIAHVHLKDIRQNILDEVNTHKNKTSFLSAVKQGVFTTPGDGVIDFKKIISLLKTKGYNSWYLVEAEQDPSIANPLEYAKNTYKYLSEILRD